mgnify:CR=1 FL=1
MNFSGRLEIYQINGKIKNNGTQIARTVEIIVTLYDSENLMIGSQISEAYPSTLNAHEIGSFTLNVDLGYLAGLKDTYVIQVQST